MDGFYKITLKSPMGLRQGNLDISSEKDKLTGSLCILDHINSLTGELVSEREFIIYGEIKTPVELVKYTLKGKVLGDEIEAFMDTSKAIMELKGRRLERDDKNGKSANK